MSILKELSKHNNKWHSIAMRICGDYDLAWDLTQTMYIKLKDRTKWNDYFITIVLKNIFLNTLKERKNVRIEELHYLEDRSNDFEPNDEQKKLLDEFDKLDWVSKELLLERSTGRSLRDIEKIYNINYGYTYRTTTKAKEQILTKNK